MIEAPGPDAIGVRVVHLDLEALRREASGGANSPAGFLVLGQHVDTAIRSPARHDVDLELEVAETVVLNAADVVGMTRRAVGNDGAISDCKRLRRSSNLPAAEVLAVEQAREARLGCA